MIAKRYVQRVLLHLHLDEVYAYCLAFWIGSEKLIGIENAEILFPKRITWKPLEQWVADKELSLGGYGDFCDEHRSGAMARLKDTCAARIMADHLLIGPSIYIDMLREVNFWDNHKGCPKTHLGSLLKMAHNHMGGSERLAFKWAQRMIEAVIKCRHGKLPQLANEDSFTTFMSRHTYPDVYVDDEAREEMLDLIVAENDDERHLMLGLRSIYEALWRTCTEKTLTAKRVAVGENVDYALALLYRDQTAFHNYRRLLQSDPPKDMKFFVTLKGTNGSVSTIRGAAVQTDVPVAHSVLHSLGYQVSIVKTTAGNATIMCDQDELAARGLTEAMKKAMQSFVGMCRYRDLPKESQRSANWDILIGFGDYQGSGQWHMPPAEWLAAYNGTGNHYAHPTILKLIEMKDLFRIAADPDGAIEWRNANRVPDLSAFMPVDEASSFEALSQVLELAQAG